ncbi:hypothetical protein HMPREF9372_2844 [Sporosarcina newyorkensis 2681]|uniref:Uncharacterized protein n=1 Tax=Sporosarcina newyorkensis 2681 TaxID=1027292 RepID=F9DVL3_9BACL|nr:hypothetical protein [Sporosarcina newyorkensis]EGQ22517.1 hypothetical protein HMPREF9372_2844 [Sporosarcina newyorkensis 2681]
MTNHQWTLNETFYFPTEYGAFSEAVEVKVTPGYTEDRTEEAIRLQGIYHIAANVTFDQDKLVELSAEDRLVIDDVEVENGTGYFEYAVPLNVDLPGDIEGPLELNVEGVRAAQLEDGGLRLDWSVHLQEIAAAQEEVVEEVAVEPKKPVQTAIESTSHLEFLANADKAVENVEKEMEDFLLYIAELDDDVTRKIFHSNNIFVEAERQTSEETE